MQPVTHFELPYDDETRAKEFYAKAFGWHIADWPLSDGSNYLGVMTGEMDENGQHKNKGVIGGGLVPRATVATPAIVLDTPDVKAAVENAVAAGAEEVSTHTYPGAGILTYIKDTEGNLIGLWESEKKEA